MKHPTMSRKKVLKSVESSIVESGSVGSEDYSIAQIKFNVNGAEDSITAYIPFVDSDDSSEIGIVSVDETLLDARKNCYDRHRS